VKVIKVDVLRNQIDLEVIAAAGDDSSDTPVHETTQGVMPVTLSDV